MSTVSPHGDSDTHADAGTDTDGAVTPAAPDRPRLQERSGARRDVEPEPIEALVGDATDIEIDLTTDPPRVVAKVAPAPQVFAGAAVYRPLVMSLVVAVAIVVGYGVVVLASVLFEGVAPDTSPFDSARPDRTIVASRGSFTEPGHCDAFSGRVFVDGDGNAIADPWDPEHDYDGIEVLVETDTGVGRRLPVASDGSWSLALDSPAVAAVTIVDAGSLADAGLWPGPRLLNEAGEAPTIGETCSLDLGLVWKPGGAASPWVGAVGAIAASEVPIADPAAEASGWRAGIQVHGRIWLDDDGDGRFAPWEQGVAGATIELSREDGSVAATAVTGTDGTYAVSNLRPTATYTVAVSVDGVVTAVRAMGEPIETDDPARVEIDTSATGMSVWGLDFGVGGGEPAVRRDRDGS
ncbi:MAG: SdrD B-like domain-containing protein [Acidimicrobiales bacterium]